MSSHTPSVGPRWAMTISPDAASHDARASAPAAASVSGTRRPRPARGPEISTSGVRRRTSAPATAA
eukprot:13276884-Alexandrium_andersonii.AAC.1